MSAAPEAGARPLMSAVDRASPLDRVRSSLASSRAERPRERLRQHGVGCLSTADLLVLLLGSGGRGAPVVAIAGTVLDHFGTVARIAMADVSELEALSGVGTATACRFVAAFELGRRAAVAGDPFQVAIRGPSDVYRVMGPTLRDRPQEEFHVLLLDTRHRLTRAVMVTRGILDASLIHPREVFRIAVGEGASAVILVHNHPSGDPSPSPEDRAVTRQLADAGRTLGIPVLDHVIVSRGGFTSLSGDLGP